MVDNFEACEFWLPPEFLTDEDFDFKKDGSDSFSRTNSDLSSPVESVLSSNESESDEDEYLTGLTQKMADSTLQEKKGCLLSTSPKSPLCKAAGEFSRRKMVPEIPGIRNQQFVQVEQSGPKTEQPGPNYGFPLNPPAQLSYQQLLSIRHLQFQEVRRQQMMHQSQQNRGVKKDERIPMALPVSPWPQLQRSQPKPQIGTGMRAVFLGNNPGGVEKQRSGTGVFLPRVASSTEKIKNQPACSPVLIPDRVVQALNLNLETLNVHNQAHHRPGYNNNSRFSAHYGAALNHNIKIKKKNELKNIVREEPENQEVFRLPSEWTY